MSEWQSIETAPNDGTQVLIGRAGARPIIGSQKKGKCVGGMPTGWTFSSFDGSYMPPTHWMPLPAPPIPTTPVTEKETQK